MLIDTEPTVGVLGMGPVKLAPGITIREIGTDSNVFDETENPKHDFVAAGTPDLGVFVRTRFVKLSAYGGAELTYYHTYTKERSVGYVARARVDFLLSRLFPFVGYGQTQTRERPNGEIDTRAEHMTTEESGGLGFQISETSNIYASAVRTTTHYSDAFESGVELGQSLSRYTDDYSGGARTALTPLTTLTMRGGYRQDLFDKEPTRNADSRYLDGSFSFLPQASINGSATFGYLDYKAVDPSVHPFRGLTAAVEVSYSLFEMARLGFTATRSLEYSFYVTEAYYVTNSFNLTYNHRLGGAFDAQVHGSWSFFDYGNREGVPAHRDTLDLVDGGLGYNLRNSTRVALNYEYSRRRAPEQAERNYDRRRIFLSWAYAF
ncbi:MAG: outer membrane beta-barrel protein [Vicinamibacterales bacterium]